MKNHPVLGILSLASLLVSPVAAQTAPAQSTATTAGNQRSGGEVVQLSPFLVSEEADQGYRAQQTMVGSRTATNVMELPASVAIINFEQLSDIAAVDVQDALRYSVSGVTQNASFSTDINIRGFRGGGQLRNGLMRGTTKHFPLYDIERVEVLKGPAAMLNGSNGGIGGTLNFVSRKPTATPRGDARISVSDAGRVRFQGNMSGPLRQAEDLRANYRVTFGMAHSDAPHGKPIEWEDQRFYAGALAFYFSNGSSLTIDASYDDNRTYFYLADFLDVSVPVDPRTNLTEARLNQYSTQDYAPHRKKDAFWPLTTTQVDMTYLTQLTENTNVRAVYYYAHTDDKRRNPRGITVQPNNYMLNRQDIRNDHGNVTHSFQIDLQHRLPLRWARIDSMAGADGAIVNSWFDQSIGLMPPVDTRTRSFPDDDAWFAMFPNDEAYFVAPRPASIGLPQTRDRSTNRSLSYYFQENISFWRDRLILIGGLRWFKPTSTTRNMVTNVITEGDSRNFRVHKYGAVFKVLPSLSVYYTDAQNVFLAPAGNTDRFVSGDKLGEPFRNSLGKLKELGVKADYRLTDRISTYGSVALFKMEQTNIRTFGTLPSGEQGIIQSAKDSSEGWEADIGVRAHFDDGHADMIVTYFDGDSAIADDQGKAYVRQAAGFVPRKFSFWGKYSWTSGPLRGLRIGGGFEDEAAKRNGAHVIHRPLTADAFAGYAFRNGWDLQLNLNNITNERYIIQVAATGLVQASDTFRSKLTLSYRW